MKTLSRSHIINLINTANQTSHYDFGGEVALNWLGNFRGDLFISMLYAKSLIGSKNSDLAISILEGLCLADPEFVEAISLLSQTRTNKFTKTDDQLRSKVLSSEIIPNNLLPTWFYSIHGPRILQNHKSIIFDRIENWGQPLWQARRSINKGDIDQAEKMLLLALGADPPTPIIQVTHLKYLNASKNVPLKAKLNIAEYYHQKWPSCLSISLLLAHWCIESQESDRGVKLIHQVIVRDIGGQIPKRIWQNENRYKELWPSNLSLKLEVKIPPEVASRLDWYQLPRYTKQSHSQPNQHDEAIPQLPEFLAVDKTLQSTNWKSLPTKDNLSSDFSLNNINENDTTISTFNNELEKLAKGIHLSGISQIDGRFPIFIVLSVRKNLEKIYGIQNSNIIIKEMTQLVGLFKPSFPEMEWGARVFIPDDTALMSELDLKPLDEINPWKLKLAIQDLDESLSRKGEMIGALLIVGGPEIVPFHNLPNPVDDPDDFVPSDNPYGTRDENYFVMEWPVGRLPGGRGTDPSLLLKSLTQVKTNHSKEVAKTKWYQTIVNKIKALFYPISYFNSRSFGYSAEVWLKASEQVFRPIGKSKDILSSPPISKNNIHGKTTTEIPLSSSRFGYFNLHGLVDAAEWYGQSDTYSSTTGLEYPVAITPEDIGIGSLQGKKERYNEQIVPDVVFSEACYGTNIIGKTIEEAISLKFLISGTNSVVGSTCMSYGSISEPLIAADLLGNSYWNYLKAGYTTGEALRLAKVNLAHEMTTRQGYLDGEDQKTIISFILYGDPLSHFRIGNNSHKSITRLNNIREMPATICDKASGMTTTIPINPEDNEYVKNLVKQYLPGMVNADLSCTSERAECHAENHTCPTSQLQGKSVIDTTPSRKVVTLHKATRNTYHMHNQYARLTLDENGNLVKLVVSR